MKLPLEADTILGIAVTDEGEDATVLPHELFPQYRAALEQHDALVAALRELVAEHDRYWTTRLDNEPGLGWPTETIGMTLARAALATAGYPWNASTVGRGGGHGRSAD